MLRCIHDPAQRLRRTPFFFVVRRKCNSDIAQRGKQREHCPFDLPGQSVSSKNESLRVAQPFDPESRSFNLVGQDSRDEFEREDKRLK
jgi:hypothetical protein